MCSCRERTQNNDRRKVTAIDIKNMRSWANANYCSGKMLFCWFKCGTKRWFRDQPMTHINTCILFVHPTISVFRIVVEFRGVFLASSRGFIHTVVRPQLIASAVEPALPPLASKNGDGQIKLSVHRTDLTRGAELRPNDSTGLGGGFWSPSEYRLCVGCSGGTNSWSVEFEDEVPPVFTGMDDLYGRVGKPLRAAGTSK